MKPNYPTLPQNVNDPKEKESRAFQLSLARTQYNYMRSYLDGVPLSADVPDGEKFSLEYEAKVLAVFLPLADNFKKVVLGLLEKELENDFTINEFHRIKESYEKLEKEMSLNLVKDIKNLEGFVKSLLELPKDIKDLINQITGIPKDIAKMATGLEQVFGDFIKEGPTAFLKSTMYDMLRETHGNNYLQAKSIDDYENLFSSLPKPLTLEIEEKSWMLKDKKPWKQDWYFCHLQIAGYNTTLLQGIRTEITSEKYTVILSELQKKFPITDEILQKVSGDSDLTLEDAARKKRLYVCDYSMLDGTSAIEFHGEQRYITAPIALFYWNPSPPKGFPLNGAMQPIAIQLGQKFDPEVTPIFTPNNSSNANDPNHYKWEIAKYVVNVAGAIQHESVAHLGACHLTIEPMIVAAHRQLSENHPILKLLIPHFRFTIQINDSALHSLIIPGGVVATNVGTAIEDTLKMVANAHEDWRFDEHNPDRLFNERGVNMDSLPVFPFRDDTLLLWKAIKNFVSAYLKTYYQGDKAVIDDTELQAWINEMVSPKYAGFKGMDKLKKTDDLNQPYKIDSLDYLIQIISQIIYIAGPQHASVNYAQYPLMTYSPSVAGTIYNPMPTKHEDIESETKMIEWYPPLDVSLYSVSFEYLLSGVQFDTFGHYNSDPRIPYFNDPLVLDFVLDFQEELAQIESVIRKRNKERPMPYLFQVPSMIPNSISI